jgi:hypothetical protein
MEYSRFVVQSSGGLLGEVNGPGGQVAGHVSGGASRLAGEGDFANLVMPTEYRS